MRKEGRREGMRYGGLHLLHSPVSSESPSQRKNFIEELAHYKTTQGIPGKSKQQRGRRAVLVTSSSPFPIHPTEPRDGNLDSHFGLIPIPTTTSTAGATNNTARAPSFGFSRSRHSANDLGVPHLEVGRAISGGLGGDRCRQSAQLIPPSPIEAKERKRVGGCIEGHWCS